MFLLHVQKFLGQVLLWHPNKNSHLKPAQHSLVGRTQGRSDSPPGVEDPLVLRCVWLPKAVQWELSWSSLPWLDSTGSSVCSCQVSEASSAIHWNHFQTGQRQVGWPPAPVSGRGREVRNTSLSQKNSLCSPSRVCVMLVGLVICTGLSTSALIHKFSERNKWVCVYMSTSPAPWPWVHHRQLMSDGLKEKPFLWISYVTVLLTQ